MPQLDLEHPGTNPMVPRTQNSLMPNHNSPLPYIPNPQNDPRPPVQRAEVYTPTATQSSVPWQNGQQPGVTYAGPYHSSNGANYGDWAQYRSNFWNEGPPPQSASLEGPYAHQWSPNFGPAPPAPRYAQRYVAPPGPTPVEHDIPTANGIPISGLAPHTAMSNTADPFSRNVPNYDPSRTSAMDDLKRVATRCLCNPHSQVGTLRLGLNPSGSRRFMVMILVEVDDI
ncbi:hypothetical protein V8E53_007911 [Lactarius tabidus]